MSFNLVYFPRFDAAFSQIKMLFKIILVLVDLLYWEYSRWIDIFSCSSNHVGVIAIMDALLLFVRFLTELVQHRKFVVDFWFVFISSEIFFLLHDFSFHINLFLLLVVDSWLEKVLNKF